MRMLTGQPAEVEIRIANPLGLHARPAVRLVKLVAKFDAVAEVKVEGGAWTNAQSLSNVMKLKITQDMNLRVRASGPQAADVLSAMTTFFEHDLDASEVPPTNLSPLQGVPTHTSDVYISAFCTSEGTARGQPVWLANQGKVKLVKPEKQAQPGTLGDALEQVAKDLENIRDKSQTAGADIVDFQLMLLRDDAFIQPIMRNVEGGDSAGGAWLAALTREISTYATSDHSIFRSRATDLEDLSQRVLDAIAGLESSLTRHSPKLNAATILLVSELFPSQFLELDFNQVKGIVSVKGDLNSHVAMLARANGIPFATGLSEAELMTLNQAEIVQMNCQGQQCSLTRLSRTEANKNGGENQEKLATQWSPKAVTALGDRITLYINVDDPRMLEQISAEHCDGIGLVRTEFLLRDNTTLFSEDAQFHLYRNIIAWAAGKPVKIRTLDAGGDKPVENLVKPETNPFLGMRGLRLSLHRRDVFEPQVRALLRAAATGPLKVMFPMVSLESEFEEARQLFADTLVALQTQRVAAQMPELGIMVETPAAALRANDYPATFFSIGTNDLTQYTFAADRSHPDLQYLHQATHPAVLDLIRFVVLAGKAKGVEVSICGESASQPQNLEALLSTGVSALSISIKALMSIKKEIAKQ